MAVSEAMRSASVGVIEGPLIRPRRSAEPVDAAISNDIKKATPQSTHIRASSGRKLRAETNQLRFGPVYQRRSWPPTGLQGRIRIGGSLAAYARTTGNRAVRWIMDVPAACKLDALVRILLGNSIRLLYIRRIYVVSTSRRNRHDR